MAAMTPPLRPLLSATAPRIIGLGLEALPLGLDGGGVNGDGDGDGDGDGAASNPNWMEFPLVMIFAMRKLDVIAMNGVGRVPARVEVGVRAYVRVKGRQKVGGYQTEIKNQHLVDTPNWETTLGKGALLAQKGWLAVGAGLLSGETSCSRLSPRHTPHPTPLLSIVTCEKLLPAAGVCVAVPPF